MFDTLTLIAIGAGGVVTSAALTLTAITQCYEKCGPNEVLIVSGRPTSYTDPETHETVRKNFRIYHGGGTFIWPVRERIDRMSVELMTLEIRTPEFFTKFGVPIVVDGIAQIKVMSDDPMAIATAAEMFLSKTPDQMNEIAHQMMQGHLRAVISTLPFEEMHANPEAFAQSVQRLTAADLANMGIQVVSFTIREVVDPSGYLQALGRPQLAEVKKNAEVGEARATRESTVLSSKAHEEAELARVSAEVEVATAEANKERDLHDLEARVAEARARREMAYAIEKLKAEQQVTEEKMGVSRIEVSKRIELEELEALRKEKELIHTVKRPTESERERIELLAHANAEATLVRGRADAEVIRVRGQAEAEALRLLGLAEAEAMEAKAAAWKQYSAAAMSEHLIEKLPAVAEAIAAPLSKIDKIVMVSNGGDAVGFDQLTRGITNVVAQLPLVAEALTGVNLRALLPVTTVEADKKSA